MIYTNKKLRLMLKEAHTQVLQLEGDLMTSRAELKSANDLVAMFKRTVDNLESNLFNAKSSNKHARTTKIEDDEEKLALQVRLLNKDEEINYYKGLVGEYQALPHIKKYVNMVSESPMTQIGNTAKLLKASTPKKENNFYEYKQI